MKIYYHEIIVSVSNMMIIQWTVLVIRSAMEDRDIFFKSKYEDYGST